ncbi:SRPBCC family protein [Salegentibacter chungangensis]|uniref:SRPBCC family protein n=1 Tax=Salegentibacter chungangensis TaxID=1335724 RepID=A0ABW3NSB1_9FLAO
MGKHGKLIAPGTLQFKVLLPGNTEDLWEYLTKSGKRGQWLASGKLEERAGGKLTLHFQHNLLSDEEDPVPEKFSQYEDGDTMEARVLLVEPPKQLSYTWAGDSEVSFELLPKEDNALLILTHKGLGEEPETLIGVAAGWHTHLDILESKLWGKKAPAFWKTYEKHEQDYKERFDKNLEK